jgi:DNA-3-methyladenine glycosylase
MNVNLHQKLSRAFYSRETVDVARELIGMRLVHHLDGHHLIGRIVETEAYHGTDDAASHAFRGKTTRNTPMFDLPGHTYIYFIYGMHWLFNISAHPADIPGGILIRAVEPVSGLEKMRELRGVDALHRLTNGPARLTQAFKLDKSYNNIDLVTNTHLYLTLDQLGPDENIVTGPRIRVPGDTLAKTRPWRFWIKDNPFVSS